ncbi:MAG: hypothetical protein ACOY46_04020 [Bacillota bacterium]
MRRVYILCSCCEEIIGVARECHESPECLTPECPEDIIMAGSGAGSLYYQCLCDDCRESLYGDPGRVCSAYYLLH